MNREKTLGSVKRKPSDLDGDGWDLVSGKKSRTPEMGQAHAMQARYIENWALLKTVSDTISSKFQPINRSRAY